MIQSEGIILASQSPRRKQLLEWAEVPFTVVVQSTDESYPAGLSFEDTAIHIARNKALAVQKDHSFTIPILAADTIVVLEDSVIGKPSDREDAIAILSALSGKIHRVITGVVILLNEKEVAFDKEGSPAGNALSNPILESWESKLNCEKSIRVLLLMYPRPTAKPFPLLSNDKW